MGTGTPTWVGVCSQRQHPLPPEPGSPRRSLGGRGRKGVHYAPPRSSPPPPPPIPARPPRGRVSSCGPRSSPERFKGPNGPAPGGPRPAAPPAGTWSPRSPGPDAGAPPETTTPEPPRQCHGGSVGGAPSPGDLGARTPLTPKSRGQLSFLRWECGRARPAAPPVHVACGCHRARGWKKPSSTASADCMTLGEAPSTPPVWRPKPATVSTGMRQVGEKPSTKPKQVGFCPPHPVPSGPPFLANSGKGLLSFLFWVHRRTGRKSRCPRCLPIQQHLLKIRS